MKRRRRERTKQEWNCSYLLLIRMDYTPTKLQSKLMRIPTQMYRLTKEWKARLFKSLKTFHEGVVVAREREAKKTRPGWKEMSANPPPHFVLNTTNKDLLNFSFEIFPFYLSDDFLSLLRAKGFRPTIPHLLRFKAPSYCLRSVSPVHRVSSTQHTTMGWIYSVQFAVREYDDAFVCLLSAARALKHFNLAFWFRAFGGY